MRGLMAIGTFALLVLEGCSSVLGFDTPTVAEHDMEISVSADGASPTPPFSTYRITVVNDGPDDAMRVTVRFEFPVDTFFSSIGGADWTCVPTDCTRERLAAGQSSVITALASPESGTVSATVTAGTPDLDLANNTGSVLVDGRTDLELRPLYPWSVEPGATTDSTFRLRNLGPATATSIQVALTASPGVQLQPGSGVGWTCATPTVCTYERLFAGEGAYSLVVPALMPQQPGTVEITGTVTCATPDPDESNNVVRYASP